MKIAFILFENLTFLDLVGFYDPVTRLKKMGFVKDLEWDMCAMQKVVQDDRGLTVMADKISETLTGYDFIFIPGGVGARTLQHDEAFIEWIKTAKNVKWKVSVCTGSLILGAAGFLKGKRATTHPDAFEALAVYCQNVSKMRIVEEGTLITGSGVATSLDLGLHVVERLAGAEARRQIAKQMDYPYVPLEGST